MQKQGHSLNALVCATLLVLSLCGCANENVEPPHAVSPQSMSPLPRSFKGYELYSWRSGRTWYFTLITGTDRLKTLDEITSLKNVEDRDWVKITVVGVAELKSVLSRLPSGAQVFWDGAHPTEPGSTQSQVRLRMPPRRLIREMQTHCAELGLRLETGR